MSSSLEAARDKLRRQQAVLGPQEPEQQPRQMGAGDFDRNAEFVDFFRQRDASPGQQYATGFSHVVGTNVPANTRG